MSKVDWNVKSSSLLGTPASAVVLLVSELSAAFQIIM